MVNIPDDEELVDYNKDDEEEPEEEPEEKPEEEPEPNNGHGNQFAQHPNPQPGNMNGWLKEDDDMNENFVIPRPPNWSHRFLVSSNYGVREDEDVDVPPRLNVATQNAILEDKTDMILRLSCGHSCSMERGYCLEDPLSDDEDTDRDRGKKSKNSSSEGTRRRPSERTWTTK
ncbi:hypothetical protein Tco_0760360 [Tanacetum coccineum]